MPIQSSRLLKAVYNGNVGRKSGDLKAVDNGNVGRKPGDLKIILVVLFLRSLLDLKLNLI